MGTGLALKFIALIKKWVTRAF